jgi:regulator of PEP synthase PpsR (kinase-PPPase family)
VRAEVDAARRFYRQHGFAVVDVTDRTIEERASEIIPLIGGTRQSP